MRKPLALYAITKHGVDHAARLLEAFPGADLYASDRVRGDAPAEAKRLPLPMGPVLADLFPAYDCHVFVISVGAVVRMVAPFLRDKKVDPAVVCVDDMARYSIPVLSGHVGRGNEWAVKVGSVLGAEPVITTASDAIGTLTVDILGRELGWRLEDADRNVTRGCAAVVNGSKVLVVQETGEPDWWPRDRSLPPGVEVASSLDGVDPSAWEVLLIVSDRDLRESHRAHWDNAVVYRPRSLCLGVGCDRGATPGFIASSVRRILRDRGLAPESVASFASVAAKSDERGILALADEFACPVRFYPADQLDRVAGIENPSEVVKKYVGTRSVAEAAALKSAGVSRLLVAKQRVRDPLSGLSMTLAVARTEFARRGEVHK